MRNAPIGRPASSRRVPAPRHGLRRPPGTGRGRRTCGRPCAMHLRPLTPSGASGHPYRRAHLATPPGTCGHPHRRAHTTLRFVGRSGALLERAFGVSEQSAAAGTGRRTHPARPHRRAHEAIHTAMGMRPPMPPGAYDRPSTPPDTCGRPYRRVRGALPERATGPSDHTPGRFRRRPAPGVRVRPRAVFHVKPGPDVDRFHVKHKPGRSVSRETRVSPGRAGPRGPGGPWCRGCAPGPRRRRTRPRSGPCACRGPP